LSEAFVGIVTGSAAEAKALTALQAPGFRIAISAADSQKAKRQAQEFVRQGAVGLVSIGLCGALDPALKTGDIIRPHWVLGPPLMKRRTIEPGEPGDGILLYGSDAVIASSARKAELFGKTGAVAVDMESHRVAKVAARAKLPFFCLRVVADTADENLPLGAAFLLDEMGSVRPSRLLHLLATEPLETVRMMRSGSRALRALGSAAEKLRAEPLFGL
jgi:adenosylhomocysteine nucleosidase